MSTRQSIRRILIRAEDRTGGDLKRIADQLNRMDRSVLKVSKSMQMLRNSFGALAGLSIAGLGVRELIRSSDELQLLTDKMSIFAREGETGLDIMNKITAVANRQGQSIENLATIYNRLEISTQELNLSSEETMAMTEVLAQSFRLAGSTALEMRGVTIQLSQALAAGALQGQELRSVMEGNALVAFALKEELGLVGDSIGEVKESIFRFAEKRGGITPTEVFTALANSADKFDEMAQKLNFTIGQSMSIAFNIAGAAWNNFNSETKVTVTIGRGIIWMAQNMDKVMAVLASTITALLIPSMTSMGIVLKSYLATTSLATIATTGLSAAMKGMGVILGTILSVKAAVVVGIGAVVYAMLNWESTTQFLGKALLIIQKYASRLQVSLGELAISIGEYVNATSLISAGSVMIDKGTKSITALDQAIESYDKTIEGNLEKKNSEILAGVVERMKEGFKQGTLNLKQLNDALSRNVITTEQYTKAVKNLRIEEVKRAFLEGKIDEETRAKRIDEILNGRTRDLSRLNEAVAKLNKEYLRTNDVEAYYKSLDSAVLSDITERFKQGRIQLEQYFQQMDTAAINKLNEEFRTGQKDVITYNRAVDAIRMESLKRQLDGNRISLEEYRRQIVAITEQYQPSSAFFVGTMDYIKQAGTISQGVANATQRAFGALEDGLTEFIKTGTFEFKKFTESILDDLNRIIVRSMIVRPLAQAIMGTPEASASTNTATTSSTAFAKGGAFDSRGVQFFSKGGVVNAPTMFKHSRGMGVAGEAGPEAIIPLKRGRGGELGVSTTAANVVVNVINQSDETETMQTERSGENGERIVDVVIINKVREGFANGSFDKQMNSQYGLRRKGG